MKLNLILFGALVASALALVQSVYEMRMLVSSLHRAEQQQQRLAGEHVRLEAERQAVGTTREVERIARERLAMRSVTAADTWYEGHGMALLGKASAPAAVARPARAAAVAEPVRPEGHRVASAGRSR